MDGFGSVASTVAPSLSMNTIPTSSVSTEKNQFPISSPASSSCRRHSNFCPETSRSWLHSRPPVHSRPSTPSARHLFESSKKTEKGTKGEPINKQPLRKVHNYPMTDKEVRKPRLFSSISTPNLDYTKPSKSPKSIQKVNSVDVKVLKKPNPIELVKVIMKLQNETGSGMKMAPVKYTLEPPVNWKVPLVRGVRMNKSAQLRTEMNHLKLNGWGKEKPKMDCAISCITVDKH